MGLQELLRDCQQRVVAALAARLAQRNGAPRRLAEAMSYAVLDGGKRIRPALVYLTGRLFGVPFERLDGPACAVELIHAYSLVHDDLPAMDNDDLRRGKPTCHRAFDEATAVLAADALQALAYQVLAEEAPIGSAPTRLRMIAALAEASGMQGMVGGQAIDMASQGGRASLSELETMHGMKTGALIRASVRLGALAGEASDAQLEGLDRFARGIGLAFQIHDDVLDVEGDTATLGKMQGADAARAKSTYTALLGLDEAKQHAQRVCDSAIGELAPFGGAADPLRDLARYIVRRTA